LKRNEFSPEQVTFGTVASKLGVTSKSQNNADGANCVNSVTREIVEMLRKIKKDLKSGVKQQSL
jgi:hypothetical protein